MDTLVFLWYICDTESRKKGKVCYYNPENPENRNFFLKHVFLDLEY